MNINIIKASGATIKAVERTLTDCSRVYDVIIEKDGGSVQFECVGRQEAVQLSEELGYALGSVE